MTTETKLTPFMSTVKVEPGAETDARDSGAPNGSESPSRPKRKKTVAVQPTFDDVLYGNECPCTRREFREYLTSQRADEMIDFFETVETYTQRHAELIKRKNLNKPKTDRERFASEFDSQADKSSVSGINESARSISNDNSSGACKVERGMDAYDYAVLIVTTFVMQDSAREINVSATVRDKFINEFKQYDHVNQPPVQLFDNLQTEMRSMLRGAFPRFLNYISTQNISEAHVWHRAMYGTIYLFVLLGILLTMVFTGISPYYRIIIITFWQGPYLMWASAYFRVCDGLARLGIRMTKEEWDVFSTIFRRRKHATNKLQNEWAKKQILKRTTRLEIITAIAGLMTGIATLFIPPSIANTPP